MAPKYRCSGDMPAAHVACDFTTDSLEAAMDHFEQTSHSVDEQCLAVECDEPYHTATYSDLPVCAYCHELITDVQDMTYGLTETGEVAYVSHTAEYHNERASLLRESARIINARKWS